mgnify:CR=1 FL=1
MGSDRETHARSDGPERETARPELHDPAVSLAERLQEGRGQGGRGFHSPEFRSLYLGQRQKLHAPSRARLAAPIALAGEILDDPAQDQARARIGAGRALQEPQRGHLHEVRGLQALGEPGAAAPVPARRALERGQVDRRHGRTAWPVTVPSAATESRSSSSSGGSGGGTGAGGHRGTIGSTSSGSEWLALSAGGPPALGA